MRLVSDVLSTGEVSGAVVYCVLAPYCGFCQACGECCGLVGMGWVKHWRAHLMYPGMDMSQVQCL